jgi:peptide deformylase
MSLTMTTFELAYNNGQEMPEGWVTPSVGTIEALILDQSCGLVPSHDLALQNLAEAIPLKAITSSETRRLIEKLKEAASKEIDAGRILVGLAAPQIGIGRCAVLANLKVAEGVFDFSALTVMINPTVTPLIDSPTLRLPEGCYSCGPVNVVTERPLRTYVSWYDELGELQRATFNGPSSIITAHEADHLKGLLAPDLILDEYTGEDSPLDWLHAEEVDEQVYGSMVRSGQRWPRQCPVGQWEAMRRADDKDGPKFRLGNFVVPRTRLQ